MSRQFIACKFRSTDTCTYTYHNDGEPVAVGDFVKVADRSGDGWKKIEVAAVDVEEPTRFPTKEILGKWEPADLLSDDDADLNASAEQEA